MDLNNSLSSGHLSERAEEGRGGQGSAETENEMPPERTWGWVSVWTGTRVQSLVGRGREEGG